MVGVTEAAHAQTHSAVSTAAACLDVPTTPTRSEMIARDAALQPLLGTSSRFRKQLLFAVHAYRARTDRAPFGRIKESRPHPKQTP